MRGASNVSHPPFALALVFAVTMMLMLGVMGMYSRDRRIGLGAYVFRVLIALLIAVPLAYLTADVVPGGRQFQETVSEWVLLAFAGLVIVRQLVTAPVLRLLLPHRVLVLGTGPEARMVEASLVANDTPGVRLVGFYPLERVDNVVPASRVVPRKGTLDQTVRELGINEIIVAVREQRGGVLPLRALLDSRLAGVRVTDLARFYERVHGQIPIDSLKASWLIYGSGFRQGWYRTLVKRSFDIVVSLTLLALMLPVMLFAALVIVMESGFPVVYRQERVGLRGKTFDVLKFRSMRQDAEKDGKAAWATVGDSRVTPFGRFLRRTRFDELPQLINVLYGEMSFVGPRPERPVFVALLTEQIPFYAVRHSVKPGITGWAQVRYSYGANVEQSMKKLEYDLYYVKNHTLLLDLLILVKTARVVMLGQGAR
ncbi:MAG: TIGR03013 family PEP-CTERM/XrtA system glycosyltransferase [Burkholderiales bacterium]|nr:TIGR03013 family PEP-CTERM/XrtA system glycosyltransferase [Burkholderiales bacterium]